MERYFKKSSISEHSIDKAAELFSKKRSSDPTFANHVISINNDPKLTVAQKDKLIGNLVADGYHKYLINKKDKGKAPASDDAAPKERISKDEDVAKAEKKHEKNKTEALKGEKDDVEFDRDAAKARLSKLFGG
jgi:hypothetical protein